MERRFPKKRPIAALKKKKRKKGSTKHKKGRKKKTDSDYFLLVPITSRLHTNKKILKKRERRCHLGARVTADTFSHPSHAAPRIHQAIRSGVTLFYVKGSGFQVQSERRCQTARCLENSRSPYLLVVQTLGLGDLFWFGVEDVVSCCGEGGGGWGGVDDEGKHTSETLHSLKQPHKRNVVTQLSPYPPSNEPSAPVNYPQTQILSLLVPPPMQMFSRKH